MIDKKGILAGVFIGFAGVAYLLAPSKIIGAILFSLGLISVILFESNLYTGKIAYVNKDNVKDILKMLLWNIAGAGAVAIVFCPLVHELALDVVNTKLELSYPDVLIKSIGCGICIYLAVELYKKSKNILLIALPVFLFVICGFEHCIADTFYLVASKTFNIQAILFVLISIIGNSIGSIAINKLVRWCEK